MFLIIPSVEFPSFKLFLEPFIFFFKLSSKKAFLEITMFPLSLSIFSTLNESFCPTRWLISFTGLIST